MKDDQLAELFSQLEDQPVPESLRHRLLVEARYHRPRRAPSWRFLFQYHLAPAVLGVMILAAFLSLFFSQRELPAGHSIAQTGFAGDQNSYDHELYDHDVMEGELAQGILQRVMVASSPPEGRLDWSMSQLREEFRNRTEALMQADADRLLMRGRRYKASGRIDLALKDFETIYRFYPHYVYLSDALIYRSQCYAFLGDIDNAVKSLHLVIEKFPSKKTAIFPMINQLKSKPFTK